MKTTLRVVTDDVANDAEARYQAAKERRQQVAERRDAILASWEELGCPLLSTGSTGQSVEHPLSKMVREAETHLREHDQLLERLSAPLRKRHRGPAPSAVIQASIGESPSARLRKVR